MSGPKKRFSRASVTEYLEEREERLRRRYGFDPDNGSAQVRGRSEDTLIAFGEWRAARNMLLSMHWGEL